MFKAVECGDPPEVALSSWKANATNYTSVSTYTCDEGYWMQNGAGIKTCSCNGTWTGTNIMCTGKN